MSYELRDYQRQAVDAAVSFFVRSSAKRNGIIVLPTGAGKSLVIANIAMRLDEPLLIFQPSKEILEQNYEKLQSYNTGVECGIFSASMKRKDICRVTFATIGSAVRRKSDFFCHRYIIVDECHYVNAQEGMYKDFIDAVQGKVLGLTATPYRLYSTRFYGSMLRFITRTRPRVFTDLIYHVQVRTLQDRGYLAKMSYYSVPLVNPRQLTINSTGADYTDASVRRVYREVKFTESLADIVVRLLSAGRKTILVFTRFVDEAQNLVANLGDKAALVSGTTPKQDREDIIRRFKRGDGLKVVANVGVLTTGFDFPALSTVVIARPTMSLALYYQMCGRAIRPCGDKRPWVVDLCGAYNRFGRVDDLELKQTRPGIWAVFSGDKQLTNVFFNR